MSFDKILSLSLQTVQSAQIAKANQALGAIKAQQTSEAEVRTKQAELRGIVFAYHTEMQTNNLNLAFFLCESFRRWCRLELVSGFSFEALGDMELLEKTKLRAGDVAENAKLAIPPEEIAAIQQLTNSADLILTLRSLACWTRAKVQMKGGFLIWNGRSAFSGSVPVLLMLVFVAAVIATVCRSSVPSWAGWLCVGLAAAAMVYRAVVASKIAADVSKEGGTFTSRTKGKDVTRILEELRADLQKLDPELNPADREEVEQALQKRIEWAQNQCDKLSIPRELALP